MYLLFKHFKHTLLFYDSGRPSSIKGNAVLNDPNDPNVPGELVVNFGFGRK